MAAGQPDKMINQSLQSQFLKSQSLKAQFVRVNAMLAMAALVAGTSASTNAVARSHGRARHSAANGIATTTKAAPIASGGSVATAVDSWLKRPEIAHSRIGVEVMELPSGRLLYS